MRSKAPRRIARIWDRPMRGALTGLSLWLIGTSPAATAAAEILSARYVEPTNVYGHGAVPGGEFAGLEFHLTGGRVIATSARNAVYEDTAPRLVDVTGDGKPEVITVVSYFDRGAALRVWTMVEAGVEAETGTTMAVLAETPPIGRRHRWLAVIGAADLDGDGAIEIAYIDRPHLAKTLRVWRLSGGALTPVASLEGLTNHKYGDPEIEGGIRSCPGKPAKIITASADWRLIMATELSGSKLSTSRIGPYTGADSLSAAMRCPQ